MHAADADSLRSELASLAGRTFTIGDAEINCRPIIAWALNDRLEDGPLTEQLLSFKRAGYGGIMLEVWRGCPYPVMSDEWLERVGFILKLAQQEGLEIWIWDDWVFPSGPAGGVVTRDNDDFKSKILKITIDVVLEPGETIDLSVPARSLAVAIFPVDKFNNPCGAFHHMPATPGETIHYTATVRERLIIVRWQLVSAMQNTPRSQMECPDIYTSDDPEVFSVDMLNPAATRRFIEVIHERYYEQFSAYFGNTMKGFFYDEPGQPSQFPWTEGLAEEFRRRKGYDLLEQLAPMMVEFRIYDVLFDLQSEAVKQVRADYMDVWTSLMADAFFGQLKSWCAQHGVACTGHMSNDESLKPMVANTGQHFKNLSFSDMPGTDVVFNQLDPGMFVDFPRLAGSRAAVLGRPSAISESFAVTGHGTDLDAMRYVAEHQIIRGINKFFDMLANYNPIRGLYFHPPELSDSNLMMRKYGHHLHARMGNLCALMSSGEAPARIALLLPIENYYRGENIGIAAQLDELAQALTYHQREFDYLCDQDLLEMSAQGGTLRSIGGQRYSHLVIPKGARCSDALKQQIAAFADSGCAIIFGETNNTEQVLSLTVDETLPFAIDPEQLPVSLARRILPDGRQLVFLLNESLDEQSFVLELADGWQVLTVDPEELSIEREGDTEVFIRLEPTESRLLLLNTSDVLNVPNVSQGNTEAALKLVDWELELPDGQTAQLSMPLPSWNALGYPEYYGTMRYRTTFTSTADMQGAMLSLGDLRYLATVYLDGQPVGDCVFTPRSVRLRGLQPGEHRLEIEVLNTMANLVCGTDEQYRRLEESGVFRGSYAPIYIPRDKKRVISGLLGPVTLTPVSRV